MSLLELPEAEAIAALNDLKGAVARNGSAPLWEAIPKLPKRLEATPLEVHHALVGTLEFALRLGHDLGSYEIPEDAEGSPLAHRWLRLTLLRGDLGPLKDEPTKCASALRGTPLAPWPEAPKLFAALASHSNAELARRSVEALPSALAALAIDPSDAVAAALAASAHPDDDVQRAFWDLAGAPWLKPHLKASLLSRGICAPERTAQKNAIAIAGERDMPQLLWPLAEGEVAKSDDVSGTAGSPATPNTVEARNLALAALGHCLERSELSRALAAGRSLPAGDGPRRMLERCHHRGVLIPDALVPEALLLFDANPNWPGEEFAEVLFTSRQRLLEELRALPFDDPRWERRAAVVARCAAPQSSAVLTEVLAATTDPDIALACLDALRTCAEFGDDPSTEAVHRWLRLHPEAGLEVLAMHGESADAEAIVAALQLPGAFGKHREKAARTAFLLADDPNALFGAWPGWQTDLPEELLLAPVFAPEALQALLANLPAPKGYVFEANIRQLHACAAAGQRSNLAYAEARFRDACGALCEPNFPDNDPVGRPRHNPPVDHPSLLASAVEAFGQRLTDLGALRSPYGEATPIELLRIFAFRWLGELSDAPWDLGIAALLLDFLRSVGIHSGHLPPLRMLWRHHNPEVRRRAAQLLITVATGTEAALQLPLVRLAREDEFKAKRQGLRAIGLFEARSEEAVAIAALRHSNMNLKKAAAEALGQVASDQAIPPLVAMLAHQSNPGLQALLQKALLKAAGDAAGAVLRKALREAKNARSAELLLQALAAVIPLDAVATLHQRAQLPQGFVLSKPIRDNNAPGDLSPTDDPNTNRYLSRPLAEALLGASSAPELRLRRFDPEQSRLDLKAIAPRDLARALRTIPTQDTAEWVVAITAGTFDDLPATHQEALRHWCLTHLSAHPHPAIALGWLKTVPPAADGLVLDALDALFPSQNTSKRSPRGTSPAPKRSPQGTSPAPKLSSRVCFDARRLLRSLPTQPGRGEKRWRTLLRFGAVPSLELLQFCLRDQRPDEELPLIRRAFNTRPGDSVFQALRPWSTLNRHAQETLLAQLNKDHPLAAPKGTFAPKPKAALAFEERTALERQLQGSNEHLGSNEQLGSNEHRSDQEAADRLLTVAAEHPSTAKALLNAYLEGRIEIDRRHHEPLGRALRDWPPHPKEQDQAIALLPAVPEHRVRAWLPLWATQCEGDSPEAAKALRTMSFETLADAFGLNFEGAPHLHRLDLPRGLSPAPQVTAPTVPAPIDTTPPLSFEELTSRLQTARPAEAVVLARQLFAFRREALPSFRTLCTSDEQALRQLGLRGVHRFAERDEYLDTAHRMLRDESFAPLRERLIRILGHGRHAPALDLLLGFVEHPSPRVRKVAIAALLPFGSELIATAEHRQKKARPDRRRHYEPLLTKLSAQTIKEGSSFAADS